MTPREILGEFRIKCPTCMWNIEQTTCQNCKDCLDQALLTLQTYYLSKLPKEEIDEYNTPTSQGYTEGYNICLADCRERIGKK